VCRSLFALSHLNCENMKADLIALKANCQGLKKIETTTRGNAGEEEDGIKKGIMSSDRTTRPQPFVSAVDKRINETLPARLIYN
jgi:hypothetical protein